MLIGIDIGGTNIKGVILDENYNTLQQVSFATNDQFPNWQENVKQVINQLQKEFKILPKTIGISAPGIPDEKNKCIAYMPGRLAGLENFDWESYSGIKTYVLNDANAAMVAESRIGCAKNVKHAFMITLGTGMGGSILIDRKIYTGMGQKGGHLGHITIDATDPILGITGQPGNIEEAIGDCSIARRSNGKFHSTKELLDAMQKGDDQATAIWMKSLQYLAIALSGLANVLSPEMIIIGGGIANAGDTLMYTLKKYYTQYEWRPGIKGADLVFAQLGTFAGAIGAAIFAHEKTNEWI